MSNFINIEDYPASIHMEILDALIRNDRSIIEIIEDRTLSEMRSFLSIRYNCDKLFGATGTDRIQVVLMMALDIAIYHIFCIHNPQKLSVMRRERYERAMTWLKEVNRGRATIDGAPLLPDETLADNSRFLTTSNPKRVNHY